MATLNEVMIQTAEAIREKTGKSELIKPVDFASEIKSISVGGGSAEGGSTFEYLDITNVTVFGGDLKFLLLQVAYMCKIPKTTVIQKPDTSDSVTIHEGVLIASGWALAAGGFKAGTEALRQSTDAVSAMSINFSETINIRGQVMTIGEMFAMYGMQAEIDAIPRITKEQFYDLNA
jgi:hypothetical protein